MPETVPTISPFAFVVLMVMLLSMIGAWIWAILRFAFRLPVLPPDTPRLVPWGGGSVLAVMLVWVATLMAVPLLYSVATRKPGEKPKVDKVAMAPGQLMTLSAAQNLATLIVIPLTLAATAGARLRDLGIVREGAGKQILRGVMAYPLLAPGVLGVLIASVLYWGKTPHPLEDAIALDKSPGMAAILVLAGVILAPAAEELIFRGVLLGWLTRLVIGVKRPVIDPEHAEDRDGAGDPDSPDGRPMWDLRNFDPPSVVSADELSARSGQTAYNAYAAPFSPIRTKLETVAVDPSGRVLPLLMANVIVSLVFATLHAPVWPSPIPIFFLSLGLGLLYQRTGSIIAPIALHMTFNGVSTLLMFLTLSSAAPKTPKVPIPSPPPVKVTSILGEFQIPIPGR